MRPLAPLGLLLLLPACSMVGSPLSGFGGFFGDTVSFRANPNRPEPDSDNARRVMGQEVETEPMLPEPGNIWPTMPRSEPTRTQIEQRPAPVAMPATPPAATPAPPPTPAPQRPMSSPVVPAPVAAPQPAAPTAIPAAPTPTIPSAAPLASGTVVQTGKGGAVITTGGNGIMNYTLPSGGTGRAIDNGNGTMTLIGTDGSVMSVPTPR